MTATPEEQPFVRDDLREVFAALDVRPGLRAELVSGETIVVAVDDCVRDAHGLRLHRNGPDGQ